MNAALEMLSLVLIGWIAGAETGSWCCVQPVVGHLPYEQQVAMEKGMLRTFGRIMPVLMPLSAILAVLLVVASRSGDSTVLLLRVIAAICIAAAIVTTLTVNVPINTRTAAWPVTADSAEWKHLRTRWHFFQSVRAALFTAAFVMLAAAIVLSRRSSP
jgi:hypothetical protein